MAPPAPERRFWPTLIGLYLFAVGVNLLGITWGLPGQGHGLLPLAPPPTVANVADRSWAKAQDPGRDLSFGPPDPDKPETVGTMLRRFYLFTADPDEVVTMMAVARLNPFAGRWDPGITHYGGFFIYALGVSFKLASAGHMITIQGDPSFYVSHPEAMGRIYLVGRLLVALVGALAIPLTWIIARPMYGGGIALLAAATAALVPAWIAWSHIMKPWAFGAPFALAALLVGQRILESSHPRRHAAWAGVLAGLAGGAALHYFIVLLGPWIGIGLRRNERAGRRLTTALVAAGTGGLTLLAMHPYWFLAPARTIAAWQLVSGVYPPSYSPTAVAAFFWGSLGSGLGVALVAIGTGEGLFQMWRHRQTLPILAPMFMLLILMALKTSGIPGDGLHARVVLPALLVVTMLGIGGLSRAGRALPGPIRFLPAAATLPTLLVAGALLRDFTVAAGQGGTRHLAGAWLNTLPEGTSLGILAPLAPFRSPYFRMDRFQLVIEPHPDRGAPEASPALFLVAERSGLPGSSSFLARYREARRFAPPRLPLGLSTLAVYPFADPPIIFYARRASGG